MPIFAVAGLKKFISIFLNWATRLSGPIDLDPAVVAPRDDLVDLVERVVAVLGVPEVPRERVEGQAEVVAVAVREELLDVRPDLPADRTAGGEERVVGRGRAVVVQAEDRAGQVIVIRRGSAELVVRRGGEERAVGQVLKPPAAAVIADLDVDLAVRAEPDLTAVVIALRRARSGCSRRADRRAAG